MNRPDFLLLDAPPEPDSHGEPVLVFFDTEFTDLTSSELLSIGFTASEFEAELYIEIEGAWSHPGCTDFVRQAVLPLFGRHNPETLSQEFAADRIESWFDELRDGNRRRGILLASDSGIDQQISRGY